MTDDQGWGVGEAGTHAAVATVPPQDAQLIGAEVVHSGRRRAMRRLRRDKAFLVSITILVLLVLSATIGAPIAAHLTGHGPTEQVPEAISIDGIPIGIMQHPYMADGVTPDESAQRFVLGADRLGRDQLVRLMYGARISLIVAFGATGLAMVVGITLGLLAGFRGGWTDAGVSRAIETAMSFPSLLLAVGLAVVIGGGLINVLVIIALFTWFYPARIVRNATLAGKNLLYVDAARSAGARSRRLLVVHVLPQVWGPLLVFGTSVVANNILFEAGLSYLGVGVPPPAPSWGQMLSDGVNSGLYRVVPALALVPGVALVATMLAFNLLGDSLRDAIDPKELR
jgi:ABC-type dipeptide/oligopeptide/nickel transport system permease subunit